jgi:hypothetical protein
MKRVVIALFLGVLSFVVMMFIGESFGLPAAFASLAAYFLVCQFLLSRRNLGAWWRDWRTMLALDAVILLTVIVMALVEERRTVLAQAPGMLLACCGGTLAGAFAGSWMARRASARRSPPAS